MSKIVNNSQESNTTARIERRDLLDTLIKSRTISEPGANFLRKSLDPFHDFEFRVEGLPDSNTSKVVIQEVTKSYTISNSDLDPLLLWDVHFASLPELYYSSITGFNVSGTIAEAGTVSPDPSIAGNSVIAPLVWSKTYNGGNTFPTRTSSVSTIMGGTNINDYFTGQKRLIGMAFEIHNTTADLYKQGAVTCYKMPNATDISALSFNNSSGTALGAQPRPCFISRSPPANISECLLLNGASQWEAEAGNYSVCTMDIDKCDLAAGTLNVHPFIVGDVLGLAATKAILCFPTGINAVPSRPTAFHTSGAYYTGLSPQTTLNLTVKFLIESCPTPENAQLVVLAQPSPDLDMNAIELYKNTVGQLRPACKVADNASGDFWDSVIDALGMGINLAGPAIGLPSGIGTMASGGVKGLRRIVEEFQNSAKKSKNPDNLKGKALPNKAALKEFMIIEAEKMKAKKAKPQQERKQKGATFGKDPPGEKNAVDRPKRVRRVKKRVPVVLKRAIARRNKGKRRITTEAEESDLDAKLRSLGL